jgi:hypothetical protein
MSQAPATIHGLQNTPLLDASGRITWPWLRWLNDIETKTRQTIDLSGVVTPSGVDLARPYANKILDNIENSANFQKTTPSQVSGAGRAFAALDTNNRLVDSLRDVPVNSVFTPSSGMGLSQSGTTTAIVVASGQLQFGSASVSYNGGSVDPGSYGVWYVYCDDPKYSGGPVIYVATQSVSALVANNGRLYLGKILTISSGGGSGGGGGGGTGGGGHFII